MEPGHIKKEYSHTYCHCVHNGLNVYFVHQHIYMYSPIYIVYKFQNYIEVYTDPTILCSMHISIFNIWLHHQCQFVPGCLSLQVYKTAKPNSDENVVPRHGPSVMNAPILTKSLAVSLSAP